MTVFTIPFAGPRMAFASALILGLVFLAPTSGRAQTSDIQALLDRMDRLERDIRTLNRQQAVAPVLPIADPASTGAPPEAPQMVFTNGGNALSRMLVRMDALEQEVQSATGQSERMTHNFNQLNARLDKLMIDLDYRLSRLEGTQPGSFRSSLAPETGGGTPLVSAAPSPPGVAAMGKMPPVGKNGPGVAARGTVLKNGLYQPGAQEGGTLGTVAKSDLDRLVAQEKGATGAVRTVPTSAQISIPTPATVSDVLPAGTVGEQYKFAINLIRQARNADAEIAFKAFIQAHGDDKLAGNAQYWLGETFYVRKNFMQAAQAFFEAYKKFPTGVKAPDSLLKLGMSMANMNKKSEACTTYGKLRREFSGDMRTSIKQALDKETQRLTCK